MVESSLFVSIILTGLCRLSITASRQSSITLKIARGIIMKGFARGSPLLFFGKGPSSSWEKEGQRSGFIRDLDLSENLLECGSAKVSPARSIES